MKIETCGAKTRKGTPCKRRDIYSSGRCRLHGGLSTGPRTAEGKRRSSQNARKKKPHESSKVLPMINVVHHRLEKTNPMST